MGMHRYSSLFTNIHLIFI
jgi:hypothetical protein